jgi:c-di-GMP-binding flagellar brake protein YcgR
MTDDARKPAGGAERRRHPRIETANVVNYVCVDEDGNEVAEGFGTTRDLSLGGIKLETRQVVDSPYILLLDIDLQEQMLEIRGEVVHSREVKPGVFHTGIRFVDTEEKQQNIVKSFVRSHAQTRASRKKGG